MTEDEKKQAAVFRYSVISDFVNGIDMGRMEKSRLMKEKCARKWQIPFTQKTRISEEAIRYWIRLYNNGGLNSLMPKDRSDQGQSRAMDDDTCEALICLRKEMPAATVPHLIEEMMRQKYLMHLSGSKPEDRRKFEAELPNDLWQSDVMHGPLVDVSGKQSGLREKAESGSGG